MGPDDSTPTPTQGIEIRAGRIRARAKQIAWAAGIAATIGTSAYAWARREFVPRTEFDELKVEKDRAHAGIREHELQQFSEVAVSLARMQTTVNQLVASQNRNTGLIEELTKEVNAMRVEIARMGARR